MPWSGSSSQNVVSPLSLAKDGSSGGWINVLSPHLRRWWLNYQRYFRHKPFYKLNASAFAAADHRKLHTYEGRCYRWGYFTAVPEKNEVEASRTPRADG